MKTFSILFIFLLFYNLGLTSSCNPSNNCCDYFYQIILDSFVVSQFPVTNTKGKIWNSYENTLPAIQIYFYAPNRCFSEFTHNIANASASRSHTFNTQGWILGEDTEKQHSYTINLQNKYFGGDEIMSTIEDIKLQKNASPRTIISTDKQFKVSIYYRHQ